MVLKEVNSIVYVISVPPCAAVRTTCHVHLLLVESREQEEDVLADLLLMDREIAGQLHQFLDHLVRRGELVHAEDAEEKVELLGEGGLQRTRF